MFKRLLSIAVVISLVMALAGCAALDVVGRDAVRAFADLLAARPARELSEHGEYYIATEDGGAGFYWAGAIAQMRARVAPFVEAGLDIEKLDNADEEWIYFAEEFAMLAQDKRDALAQFEYIVSVGRGAVGYHAQMDHYNVSLGDGNMFEWAKALATNDKDIVFALNPEPLIAAGVDPTNVEGWVYAEVPVDVDGKMESVWKLLKFDDVK